MSHSEALEKVCAVCCNLNGTKACRVIGDKEGTILKTHIFPLYRKNNDFFPQGICKRCIHHLTDVDNGKKPKMKLPEDYFCEIPRTHCSSSAEICTCRWCYLARLNGPQFLAWKRSLKNTSKTVIEQLCRDCGKGLKTGQINHTCSKSDLDKIRSFLEMIPSQLQGRLALALVKKQEDEQKVSTMKDDRRISLPQVHGGVPTPICIGEIQGSSKQEPMSCSEAQALGIKAGLTGVQLKSVMADIRVKFGRSVVEKDLSERLSKIRRFREFFTVKKKNFVDKGGSSIEKPLWYCH